MQPSTVITATSIEGGDRMRRRAWVVTAAVVAVLVVAGVVFAALARTGGGRTPTPGAPPPSAAPPTEAAATPSPPPGRNVRGPLDVLIVGLDTRVSIPDWQPHADAVMVLHVEEDLRSGYLYSLPRDLLVDVPAFGRARFGGGRFKLTEAMSRGSSRPGGGRPDAAQGFRLLRDTVEKYTGVKRFDAGAALTFAGLSRLTDAVGGIDLTVDQRVVSLHRRPDGTMRTMQRGGGGYVGPQMVYEPGRRHLVGWQAIDYARQRYTDGGDYTRQRHQRQVVAALLAKAAQGRIADSPERLDALLDALGETVLFETDGNLNSPVDFGYALRGLGPDTVSLVSLPGASVIRNGSYRGEQLTAAGKAFLKAAAAGDGAEHLRSHPELVSRG
jgi:polyisoprenyl-teichoic acid--peptidoglycan teichoic acid transferase